VVDERKPVQWATYPGDATPILAEGPKGPNTLGELLWPVEATYDAEAAQTRVGFSYQSPPAPTDRDRREVFRRTGIVLP
jgi:hypothetical protein